MTSNLLRCLLFLCLLVSSLRSISAEVVRVTTRDELAAALAKAKPGTTISIAAGTYRGGLSSSSLRGTKGQPIVLTAADPKNPPVIDGGGSGLHLSRPEYVELRNLTITRSDSNGLNIDDGGSKDTPARHVSLIRLTVRDVGPKGNRDGIKLSGVDDFRVEDCTIERWGASGSAIDMVGCHNGVVTGCTFSNPGADFANGVQTKGGSRDIVVSHCRFDEAGGRAVNIGGSTGLDYFRPKPDGFEARDITVEDCTFRGSMSPVAFVGVDGAVVRHNTIYRPTRWCLRILQENQGKDFVPSRKGRFENNVVVFRSDELRQLVNVGGGTAPETFTFAGNLWHCLDRPAATKSAVQLPTAEKNAVYDVAPRLRSAEKGDLTLIAPADGKHGPRKRQPAE